jgi:uracil-DNA glycosylase family 4
MALTREDVLKELELLPVWKLREQAPIKQPVEQQTIQQAAQQVESTSIQPVSAPHSTAVELAHEAAAIEVPLSDTPAETPIAMTAEEPDALWKEVPGEAAPREGAETPVFDDLPVSQDELPPLTSSLGEGRRESIMRLDWQGLQECVPNCQACGLAQTRTQTVFGVGDPNAEWLIVGEAPGSEEDKRGEPFVGQAGKLLDNMLAAIKLKRGQNVYIANVLKCRPPENRDPHGEEVTQCDPFLKRQVELIKPKLILALGKFAAQSLLNSDDTIAAMRGKLHDYNGVPVIVTYHPAYLLRNLPDKAKAWEDLCFAVSTMQGLQSAMQTPSSS